MTGAGHLISISIKRSLGFPFKRAWLRHIISTVLSEEKFTGRVQVGCVITDDENIRKLNRGYRGIDLPTDVLSFALADAPVIDSMVEFPAVPGNPVELGDIIISYPRAATQALELGHGVEDELALLLVHGTLHLLGYDHQGLDEARKMRKREKSILKMLDGEGSGRR